MSWAYSQKSGELSRNGGVVGLGYSGHLEGLNNPDMETVHDVGPLPAGNWTMLTIRGEDGLPCDYEGKRAPVIRLTPNPGTNTYGRSGFLCHGDLIGHEGEHAASLGCMIQPKYVREQIAVAISDGDDQLTVTV